MGALAQPSMRRSDLGLYNSNFSDYARLVQSK
jgi:hypothetical protein